MKTLAIFSVFIQFLQYGNPIIHIFPIGPMLMPPFHPQFTGDRQLFNGSQQPYPYPYVS